MVMLNNLQNNKIVALRLILLILIVIFFIIKVYNFYCLGFAFFIFFQLIFSGVLIGFTIFNFFRSSMSENQQTFYLITAIILLTSNLPIDISFSLCTMAYCMDNGGEIPLSKKSGGDVTPPADPFTITGMLKKNFPFLFSGPSNSLAGSPTTEDQLSEARRHTFELARFVAGEPLGKYPPSPDYSDGLAHTNVRAYNHHLVDTAMQASSDPDIRKAWDDYQRSKGNLVVSGAKAGIFFGLAAAGGAVVDNRMPLNTSSGEKLMFTGAVANAFSEAQKVSNAEATAQEKIAAATYAATSLAVAAALTNVPTAVGALVGVTAASLGDQSMNEAKEHLGQLGQASSNLEASKFASQREIKF
jgi:hypothetical protein